MRGHDGGGGAAINKAKVAAGSTVAVFGCGGVGLNVIQGAALAGAAKIIAVDIYTHKEELAELFGATNFVDASKEDPVERIRGLTDGLGTDYSFEALGTVTTIEQAFLSTAKRLGTCVVLGVCPTGSRLSLDPRELLPDRTLTAISYGGTRQLVDIPMLVDMYMAGKLKLDELVTRTMPLEEVNTAFDLMQEGRVARSVLKYVWVVGAEGWLGPNALGLIGPPSSLTAMVPVIIISLTVDYAIQAVSHYREQRTAGEPVVMEVRQGLRNVTVPLTLAAVMTIVSLLATLFSPIGVIGDFGIVAGLGVGMSLIVMLTLIPAGRTIIDRRRESRGTLKPARPISNALPGIPQLAELLGKWVTRRPAPYLFAVILVTIGLGYAATGLKSEFSIKDILPRGGSVLEDMNTLETAVGGSTEIASMLIKTEVTESRTLLNLHDLTTAFGDELRRPRAVAGPIHDSFEVLVHDWTEDSGEPGDKYDPELAALFREASLGVEIDPGLMQEFVDELVAREPGLARFLINDPEGIDTMLLQFPTYLGDPEGTRMLQEEVEDLWRLSLMGPFCTSLPRAASLDAGVDTL